MAHADGECSLLVVCSNHPRDLEKYYQQAVISSRRNGTCKQEFIEKSEAILQEYGISKQFGEISTENCGI